MGRPSRKAAPAVVKVPFPKMAKSDYPDEDYEEKGRQYQSKLADSKRTSNGKGKRLTDYEEYLLTKHFPSQEKRFLAAQKRASVNNITGVFQWKSHFFPAKKKPAVRRPKMS